MLAGREDCKRLSRERLHLAHACPPASLAAPHRSLPRAPPPSLQYGGQDAGFCFAFDEPLSHLIYAACDLILVPSMFEPCGLTQVSQRLAALACAALQCFVLSSTLPQLVLLQQCQPPYLCPAPSCALQMIAMRYGAVPVVRATGGLRDTGATTWTGAAGCAHGPSAIRVAPLRVEAAAVCGAAWLEHKRC